MSLLLLIKNKFAVANLDSDQILHFIDEHMGTREQRELIDF